MLSRRLVLAALLITTAAGCRHRAHTSGATANPKPTEVAKAPAPIPTVQLEREVATTRESSGLVLARIADKTVAFVADEDDQAILEIDTESSKVKRSTLLGERPRDLLVLADGNLAATFPTANLLVVYTREQTGALREVKRAKMPLEPLAIAATPDDKDLYVTAGAGHAIVQVDAKELVEKERWELGREPRAALVSKDGSKIYVSHAAESTVSVVNKGGAVTSVEIGNGASCGSMGDDCTSKRTARHANALVRMDDNIILATAQALPNPPAGATTPFPKPFPNDILFMEGAGRMSGYGISSGSSELPVFMDTVSLNEETSKRVSAMDFTSGTPNCPVPRAAVVVDNHLIIACPGANHIEQLRNPAGKHAGASHRVSTKIAGGPSALAGTRDDKHVWVWAGFGRTLSRLETESPPTQIKVPVVSKMAAMKRLGDSDSDSGSSFVMQTVKRGLAEKAEASIDVPRVIEREEDWLRGRELFFSNTDSRISADGRACASCHIDGRDDGITWSTPMGQRRTRVLAGQVEAGPYGWRGEHATLADHVKVTFKQLGGRGLPETELNQLLTYVRSLPKPPAAPSTNVASLARGKELYAATECGNCHGGESMSAGDRSVHDVGTGGTFMTPTLAGIGTRTQLMHDGRYSNLDTLLSKATTMGTASQLSAEDRGALVEYLRTL